MGIIHVLGTKLSRAVLDPTSQTEKMAYFTVFVLCATMVLTHAQSCNELRKPRRTDITDKGYSHLYRGWVDVQGQGVNNDYCRVVGPSPPRQPHKWVSCALAGTQGQSQYNYQWPGSGKRVLDLGYTGTAFIMDVNG